MAGSEGVNAGGRQYMQFQPENAKVRDVFKHFVTTKKSRARRLNRFAETDVAHEHYHGLPTYSWVVIATLLLQRLLLFLYKPMKFMGDAIEFFLNLLALNNGLGGLLWRALTWSVVIPMREAENYSSIISHIDNRIELHRNTSLISFFSMLDPRAALNNEINYLDLSMMAAKLAYENEAYTKNAITNHLKMNFVGFYNCWNKYVEDYTTQAFIFTDRWDDANLIVVAFRGTEAFNSRDWSTDVDLSWLCMGKLGNLHMGFLKALGLQDHRSCNNAFPKDFNPPADKPLAYYALRNTLRTLVARHRKARILVTGHSLGGALAAIFPALLSMHEENEILDAMYAVMTYGQPRVGDHDFVNYMTNYVPVKYYRMVYRYDIVPRIPFDAPPVARFKHHGTCIFYDGWYSGEVVAESPNPNYFDPLYALLMHLCAAGDLMRALLIEITEGKDFREGFVSIMYRACGLLLPGVACHSPRDYINSGRLSKIPNKIVTLLHRKLYS